MLEAAQRIDPPDIRRRWSRRTQQPHFLVNRVRLFPGWRPIRRPSRQKKRPKLCPGLRDSSGPHADRSRYQCRKRGACEFGIPKPTNDAPRNAPAPLEPTIFAIFTLAGAVAPLLMAIGFDRTGSYRAPLSFFLLATLI